MLSLLLLTMGAMAAPVSKDKAKQEAQAFLTAQNPAHARKQMKQAQTGLQQVAGDNDYYYVFNVGDNDGFVIVSGDDRTTPVLGYSDQGSFDLSRMPENMKSWLGSYAEQLKALSQLSDTEATTVLSAPRKARQQTRNSIAPLITAKWDQATPYWNELPDFVTEFEVNKETGDTTVVTEKPYTGCVATAMSQIMHFYKQPEAITEALPSYDFTVNDGNFNYSTVTMDALPPTSFDWSHMRDTYTGAEDEVYTSAVAHLMLYVGCSVKMQYGLSGSGSYTDDIPMGFARFGYGSKIAFRTDYTQEAWNDLVYSELADGRPMIYNGTAGSGGGHSFVCDGYEYGEFFHINWGWGGMGNGFFQLSIMNPHASGIGGSSSAEGYNMKQNIVYNIIPGTAQGGEEEGPVEVDPFLTVTAISGTTSASGFKERSGVNKPFRIEDSRRVKVSYSDHSNSGQKFEIALALLDPSDDSFEVMKNSPFNAGVVTTSALGDTRDFGAGLKATNYGTDSRIQFGEGKTGDYRIIPVFRVQGTEEWKPMHKTDRFYVEVTLYTETTSQPVYHPEKKLEVTSIEFIGEDKVGSTEQVKATVKNYGNDRFFGNLYLDFGGQQLDEYSQYTTVVQAEVPANGTRDVTFNVTPKTAGMKSAYVMTEDGIGGYDVLPGVVASVEIQSVQESEMNLSVVINAVNAEPADDANIHGVIYDSHAEFEATITNNSDGEYNKFVLAPLFIVKRNADGTISGGSMVTYKQSSLSLAAGESKTLRFEFDNLAYGSTYSMNIYARNNVPDEEEGTHVENIVERGMSKYYEIERGIVAWEGDGTRLSYKPEEGFQVPAEAAAVSLEGLQLNSVKAGENVNTLYFLGEDEAVPAGLEGKNIVKGMQAENIVLKDDYDFYTPQGFTAQNISYERTFDYGHHNGVNEGWSTIVLPFQPTKVMNQTDSKQIDWFRSAGDSGKHFWLCRYAEEDGQQVYFANAEEMLPNVPYIVAVPDATWGSKWDLRGKQIVWSAENALVKPDAIAYTSGNNLLFGGTYAKTTLESILGLTAEGSGFSADGNQTVDAFHAYFKSIGGASARSLTISIIDDNDIADGIHTIGSETVGRENVYNISGQRVNVGNGVPMQHGIYVIGGKKVMK